MARKNTLVYEIATDQSMTTSFTTSPTVVRYLDNCSFQINAITTDSIGTFQVEISNDYYVNEGNDNVVSNPGNWVPLTLTGATGGTPTVDAQDTYIAINLNQLPFYAVRLAYTATTPGTGICSIFVTDKQLGS